MLPAEASLHQKLILIFVRFRLRDRQKGSSGGWRSKRGTQSAAVTRPTTPESVGIGGKNVFYESVGMFDMMMMVMMMMTRPTTPESVGIGGENV